MIIVTDASKITKKMFIFYIWNPESEI